MENTGELTIPHGRDKKSVESKIITGRDLASYEKFLGFDRSLFANQTVLNFGCGGSNISGEVRRSGIRANVIDLDLADDPATGKVGERSFAAWPLRLVDYFVDDNSALHRKLIDLKRRLGGVSGRTFVQADGRNLPFVDRTFDTTLAFFSTYQVPDNVKRQVFKELLRVSEALHCAPVTGKEFDILEELTQEEGYELIYSRPIPIATIPHYTFSTVPKDARIKIANSDNYESYVKNTPYSERVRRPKAKSAWVISILGKPLGAIPKGNLVVMKRK